MAQGTATLTTAAAAPNPGQGGEGEKPGGAVGAGTLVSPGPAAPGGCRGRGDGARQCCPCPHGSFPRSRYQLWAEGNNVNCLHAPALCGHRGRGPAPQPTRPDLARDVCSLQRGSRRDLPSPRFFPSRRLPALRLARSILAALSSRGAVLSMPRLLSAGHGREGGHSPGLGGSDEAQRAAWDMRQVQAGHGSPIQANLPNFRLAGPNSPLRGRCAAMQTRDHVRS